MKSKLLELLPDNIFLRLKYYKRFKRKLDLNNPKRFSEKLMWYKLYYRDPLMVLCSDKFKVRKYIEGKGLKHLLVPLYDVYSHVQDIDIEKLPASFILKTNNGSDTNYIVKDKSKETNHQIISIFSKYKDNNEVVKTGREWCYKNIEFKITAEKLLYSPVSNEIDDYKFLCFNGKVEYVWVDKDRYTNHTRTFFDTNWNKLQIESDHPIYVGDIEKPKGFKTMFDAAEKIAKDFPFARVDFYDIEGEVFFGEITFYPWSGFIKFNPDRFDHELGRLFTLPERRI